ncbi:hypothetical protein ALQ71_101853 [Pseudomonas coronafaciens pv. striafaciens]|nr:hypothetical protein ALQ71_101853 [Pseudomonas coronafaciens pv. striafaciens]RMP30688.1 hypothetical protein ALQ25_102000 [Pseudomonas coronafaciens pv. atropurpurea]
MYRQPEIQRILQRTDRWPSRHTALCQEGKYRDGNRNSGCMDRALSSARQAWQEGMKKLGTQVFEAGPNLYAVDNDSMFTPQKLAKKDDRK